MKTQEQKFSNKNGGFTLVELLVTIAILGFVILAIGGALVSSAKSYRSGNVEVDLQQQSQITANLISSLVQDASTVSFVGGDKLEIKQITSEGEFTYTIQQIGTDLMYSLVGVESDGTPVSYSNELLAEHLSTNGFKVDVAQFDDYKNVAITLEFEEDNKTFKTTYNMTARNGNGEASTALLAVKDVVLEPDEDFTFPTVTNRPITITQGLGSSKGSLVKIEDGELKVHVGIGEDSGLMTFKVSTVSADASEDVITETVNVYVRRVAKVDLKATYDGGMYAKDTKYVIKPSFAASANTNLKSVPNAYKGSYNYRDFEDVVWSVEEGASLIRNDFHCNFSDTASATECKFEFYLKNDLQVGDRIVIRATAIRPSHMTGYGEKAKGYGRITDFSADVYGEYIIEKKTDIRRGTPYEFPKTEEQEATFGGTQTEYYYRFSNADKTNKDEAATWAGTVWTNDGGIDTQGHTPSCPGNGHYTIQGDTLGQMDPTKSYLIQIVKVSKSDADTRSFMQVLNSMSAADLEKYSSFFEVDGASISLQYVKSSNGGTDNSVLGKKYIGTEDAPYDVRKEGTTQVVFEALAHSPNYFKSNMIVKSVRKKNGAGWDTGCNTGFISFDNANDPEGKCAVIKFTDPRNYGYSTGDVLEIVFDWKSGVVDDGDTSLTFYNTSTQEGIFYIKLTD